MAKRIDPDEYVRIGTAAKLAGVTRAYITQDQRRLRRPLHPLVMRSGINA